MTTTAIAQQAVAPGTLTRVVAEGYGPGAWHGPDLKTALEDVSADIAFRRPARGRHNIAEIALHHAFCARAVRGQLTGTELEPFVLDGEDWFGVDDARTIEWSKARATVEAEQQRLAGCVADIDEGRTRSPLAANERLKLVLGITCHAVYHAGQIQLIKRLLTK